MVQEQLNNPVIILAKEDLASEIYELVHGTIEEIYTKYYSGEAVGFFLELHSEESILKDISEEKVYAVTFEQEVIGTGTLDGNHIRRLFVSPQFQGRGIGTLLMDFFESEIIKTYGAVYLDSSLPA